MVPLLPLPLLWRPSSRCLLPASKASRSQLQASLTAPPGRCCNRHSRHSSSWSACVCCCWQRCCDCALYVCGCGCWRPGCVAPGSLTKPITLSSTAVGSSASVPDGPLGTGAGARPPVSEGNDDKDGARGQARASSARMERTFKRCHAASHALGSPALGRDSANETLWAALPLTRRARRWHGDAGGDVGSAGAGPWTSAQAEGGEQTMMAAC